MSTSVCNSCGGCADGYCHGCEKPRWCSGSHLDGICNACPRRVPMPIENTRGIRLVPCVRDFNHGGDCRTI